MKVNYLLLIDYQPISVLYKFQSYISTNSREIKRLVSMANFFFDLADFDKKSFAMVLRPEYIDCQ